MAYQHFFGRLDPIAEFKGPASKEKRGKGMVGKREGKGQEGKRGKEGREEKGAGSYRYLFFPTSSPVIHTSLMGLYIPGISFLLELYQWISILATADPKSEPFTEIWLQPNF